jgi:fatty-acid desaturase
LDLIIRRLDTEIEDRMTEPIKLRKIIKDVMGWIIQEIKNDNSFPEIQKYVIDPLLTSVLQRLLPYIITSSIVFLVILIMLVVAIAWFLPLKR